MRLRVIFLTAIATSLFAVLAWAVQPYNTSGRWACFAGTCVIGHAQADAIQLLTDGTGTAEIVLPTGSIDTGEVLANTLTFADISNSSAIDATTYFTAADTISLELVPSATAGDTDFFVINANQVDDANATDDFRAMVIELTSESGDGGDTMIGLAIEVEEGTANTVIDAAISIDNAETTASTLTDAILITSSGVNLGVTDGLDVSAASIVNAVNIGSNPILGGDETMTIGATDDAVEVTRNDAGAVLYTCADDDADADCVFAGGGAGKAILGDSGNASAEVTTDGGTVTIDGSITSDATGSLGWSIVAGANTACNTTCTSACVMGFELDAWDATSVLNCADATADTCLCAGAS